MKFKIIHKTEYKFDSEVFLEPHYLRFKPRETPYATIEDFSMSVVSKPMGLKRLQDEENNTVDFYWFDGMTKKLSITTKSILETKPFNPFDFIIHPQAYNKLPFKYDEVQKKLLFTALEPQCISKKLQKYGDSVLKKSNFNTVSYLIALTSQIYDDFIAEYRKAGSPLLPEETFLLKKGSCRDLTWMQINILRSQGIAARFVSGYYYYEMDKPKFELHAWVEVFLPGAGWIGLDPSHGILTGNTHFPIASSAYYENTMPVSGGIRGSSKSKLITQLSIEKI
jgi:transglutaminase-like putative cysteine protease